VTDHVHVSEPRCERPVAAHSTYSVRCGTCAACRSISMDDVLDQLDPEVAERVRGYDPTEEDKCAMDRSSSIRPR